MEEQTFLGSGWSFPPHFHKGSNTVVLSHNEQNVKECLRLLLDTQLGERILLPEYGTRLKSLVFAPFDSELVLRIQELVKKSILENESRIAVEEVVVTPYPEERGRLNITVHYTVPETNNRFNFVYPFYLIEGTELPDHVRS
ncbi:MAG: GPW/gp25 family protein [Bacteroidota bacterium]